ncbi:MAG: hypothetical protein ACYDCF_10860, partial [Burkholderiales bacterium]
MVATEAFRVLLELKTPYIPPDVTPTLDGILWGALSRKLGQAVDVPLENIPLTRSHGVFHGSRAAVADALSDGKDSVTFYRSLSREREQMPDFFFDKKRYPRFAHHSDVADDMAKVAKGDMARGFFKTLMNAYPVISSDTSLAVVFFGHG